MEKEPVEEDQLSGCIGSLYEQSFSYGKKGGNGCGKKQANSNSNVSFQRIIDVPELPGVDQKSKERRIKR